MVIDSLPTVRLHGHVGQLRLLAPSTLDAASGPPSRTDTITDGLVAADPLERTPTGSDDHDHRWVWEGSVDGPGIASLVRSVLVHGVVPCELDGRPHRARALGCWYDAGHGTVIVELAGRPHPLA